MRLSHLLCTRGILPEVRARDKWSFFRDLSRILAEEVGIPVERIEQALTERERLGSTALGEGVALPHARIPLLSRLYVSVARSPGGIEFDSPDGQPVYLIFTVLAPEEACEAYLRCLSYLARLLKYGEFREALLSAHSREEMIEIIRRYEREF